MSVNRVTLLGRLGNDPEVRFIPSGQAVANFNIATNEMWNDKNGQRQEKTEWHRIVVWGKQAQNCGEYLKKGSQVFLEGRLQTRQWQDKEGQTRYTTEVVANTVQFLSSGSRSAEKETNTPSWNEEENSHTSSNGSGNGFSKTKMEQPSFAEEDIPF